MPKQQEKSLPAPHRRGRERTVQLLKKSAKSVSLPTKTPLAPHYWLRSAHLLPTGDRCFSGASGHLQPVCLPRAWHIDAHTHPLRCFLLMPILPLLRRVWRTELNSRGRGGEINKPCKCRRSCWPSGYRPARSSIRCRAQQYSCMLTSLRLSI